ncbi:MAG: metallophosphoesterase family protein [Candidatus Hodarchaeales archaeon]|jgi:putative phosphoesterase
MKTIGVISDTHIPTRQAKLPLDVLSAFNGVDLIIHAGDFESLTVADALEEIAPLKAVTGNMCWNEVREKFPHHLIFKVEELTIGVTHGRGRPSGHNSRVIEAFKNKKPDIIVSGHTHMPDARVIDGTFLLNPGSPTDKRFAKKNTVAILQIDKSSYKYSFLQISPKMS